MEYRPAYVQDVEARENVFLRKVYTWMALGLLVTAVTAYLVAVSAPVQRILFGNPIALIAVFVAEIAVVMILSGRVETLSTGTVTALFFAYSLLTGATFSSIVLLYAGTGVLFLSFLATSVVFGSTAVYGAVTKKSVKGWSSWLFTGMFALIIVSLVNMFLGSSMLDMLICGAGVVIFAALTAWDSQKLMAMNREYGSFMTEEELHKLSIIGALDLYLDFINIFLYIVRILGRSRDR